MLNYVNCSLFNTLMNLCVESEELRETYGYLCNTCKPLVISVGLPCISTIANRVSNLTPLWLQREYNEIYSLMDWPPKMHLNNILPDGQSMPSVFGLPTRTRQTSLENIDLSDIPSPPARSEKVKQEYLRKRDGLRKPLDLSSVMDASDYKPEPAHLTRALEMGIRQRGECKGTAFTGVDEYGVAIVVL